MSPTLSRALLGLVVLVCAVAQLFLLRSILRTSVPRGYEDDRRKNPRRGFRWGADRRTQPQSDEGARSGVSEVAWGVIPAIGLIALLYFAWLALPAR